MPNKLGNELNYFEFDDDEPARWIISISHDIYQPDTFTCSKCGYSVTRLVSHLVSQCPYCKSKMKEV